MDKPESFDAEKSIEEINHTSSGVCLIKYNTELYSMRSFNLHQMGIDLISDERHHDLCSHHKEGVHKFSLRVTRTVNARSVIVKGEEPRRIEIRNGKGNFLKYVRRIWHAGEVTTAHIFMGTAPASVVDIGVALDAGDRSVDTAEWRNPSTATPKPLATASRECTL